MSARAATSFIWNGVFATWRDACAAAGAGEDAGFRSERWIARVVMQLETYRAAIARGEHEFPPRPCNLPLVAALMRARSIIDLGGSSGWVWEYLRTAAHGAAISSYVVVETPALAAEMAGRHLHGPPVAFQTLEDDLAGCDLVYCNSVMQYFEDNEPLLNLLARTAPATVLLDDLVAVDGDDFYTTQGYFEYAIPYRFIGADRLLSELGDFGYRLAVRTPYMAAIHGIVQPFEMSNFPPEKRLRYSSTLLLTREPLA